MKKDCKVGGFKIKADDIFVISIKAIHYNSEEWQRPLEFLPQRFDHSDPLSLTPYGTKRNPYSFIPFNAGKRICFGKTFAEMSMRTMALFLAECFDFECVDKKYTSANLPLN